MGTPNACMHRHRIRVKSLHTFLRHSSGTRSGPSRSSAKLARLGLDKLPSSHSFVPERWQKNSVALTWQRTTRHASELGMFLFNVRAHVCASRRVARATRPRAGAGTRASCSCRAVPCRAVAVAVYICLSPGAARAELSIPTDRRGVPLASGAGKATNFRGFVGDAGAGWLIFFDRNFGGLLEPA